MPGKVVDAPCKTFPFSAHSSMLHVMHASSRSRVRWELCGQVTMAWPALPTTSTAFGALTAYLRDSLEQSPFLNEQGGLETVLAHNEVQRWLLWSGCDSAKAPSYALPVSTQKTG